jgi:hypothetical protein
MTILQLCCFGKNGKLYLSPQDINEKPFIAISHVWGKPSEVSWCDVEGIPSKVPLSPQKYRFLSEQLPGLVKGAYFWMDVLAVDQSSKEARLSVVKHIPKIYRQALYTLVIREKGGLQSCCCGILYLGSESTTPLDRWVTLDQHLKTCHPDGVQEVWLERNWPLQELNISDTVRFATCEQLGERERLFGGQIKKVRVDTSQVALLVQDLWNMAENCAGCFDDNYPQPLIETFENTSQDEDGIDEVYDTQEEGEMDKAHSSEEEDDIGGVDDSILRRRSNAGGFLDALFCNGAVSRLPFRKLNPSVSRMFKDSIDSTRRSGKSRDFILAVFLQFPWYITPPDLMMHSGFGSIYQDCMIQLQGLRSGITDLQSHENFAIYSKITDGMLQGLVIASESSIRPSCDVPEPMCLGDLCKLVCIVDSSSSSPELSSECHWYLRPVRNTDPTKSIISLVSDTMWYADYSMPQLLFSQFARWNSEPKQLLDLLGMGNIPSTANTKTPPGQEPISWAKENLQDLDGSVLKPMEAVLILSAILKLHWQVKGPSLISFATEHVRAQHPNSTEFEAMNLREPAPIHEELSRLFKLFDSYDSPEFRETLLLLTTTCFCGFGMSAIPWLREKLEIYALKYFDGQTERETLIFAAKGLDTEELNENYKRELINLDSTLLNLDSILLNLDF